jgi:hypothetical protein
VPELAKPIDVTPSARRLTRSMRDIGYGFPQAIADLVDNSVSADARRVDVVLQSGEASPYVMIADDGFGMTDRVLSEALRFGTRRSYRLGELGRFGLGLKTASISQCRRVTVLSRHAAKYRRLVARSLDLEHIEHSDKWEIVEPPMTAPLLEASESLSQGPGTVVIWENLDRVLSGLPPEGGWARRRMAHLVDRTAEYLGMVFHRFIEEGPDRLAITVNGEKVRAWNPFAPGEERLELPAKRFEVATGAFVGEIWLRPYVLPPRNHFSSPEEFDRLSGPRRWNRQQGLYVYRANRLIQSGGWSGIRAADEHTKLARASLEFDTGLDSVFLINVAKSRVSLPPEIRSQIERPLQELCHQAELVYRQDGAKSPKNTSPLRSRTLQPNRMMGVAIRTVAMEVGEYEALSRIIKRLRLRSPSVADQLGW